MTMEDILIIMVIILLAAVTALLLRLWRYQKQISHIKEQLLFVEAEESNYLLTSVCDVGKTREFINVLNEVLEKFRQKQRRLRKVNQSYRESIASISHDIRTPLTSVKGYVQMQQKTDLSEEKKEEYAAIVERRLEELADILNQLFEYARIEAGEISLKRERINVGNFFIEIISMFYEDFFQIGFEPQIEIPKEALFIQADRHAFARILENLIKNALVHGKGNYRFCLASHNGFAVISIANETDQIEEKDLRQIFDRFYTTDQSRNRRTTGLGLAIAKEFTEQMEGTIQAFFRQGRFTVELCFPLL
ncbi:sensor histidine kinase [Lachnospiraceae bacterium]|nr:sensor histidine kinase [Lachnospiraceae bacterium]